MGCFYNCIAYRLYNFLFNDYRFFLLSLKKVFWRSHKLEIQCWVWEFQGKKWSNQTLQNEWAKQKWYCIYLGFKKPKILYNFINLFFYYSFCNKTGSNDPTPQYRHSFILLTDHLISIFNLKCYPLI